MVLERATRRGRGRAILPLLLRGAILRGAILLGAGCHLYPLGAPGPGEPAGPARPTRPLSEAVRARFTPVHPGFDLKWELLDRDSDLEHYRFRFQTFSEVELDLRLVTGDYYRTRRAPEGRPAPLILDSPILGGAKDDYLADRVFSRWAARAGMSCFFLHQDADILRGDRDAATLDRLVRENVLCYRKALDLFIAERRDVDPERLGSFGISLGAIKNVILIAVEPRLKANVLCLAGGDLPRILQDSQEGMVRRYLRRRCERDGLDPIEVADEFRRDLTAEPILLAECIPPERTLLYLGTFDVCVPYACGLALRRALGRPELHTFPLGHYSGILAAPSAARRGFRWMEERFGERH